MSRPSLSLLILALVTCTSIRAAHADPPPADGDGDADPKPAAAPTDCEAARAAWGAQPEIESATAFARCEVQAGRAAEAARILAPFVSEGRSNSKAYARAEEVFDAARSRVLTVLVEVDAAGADVMVDGAWAGRSPLQTPLFLAPGKHTIRAQMRGEEPKQDVAAGAAGSSASVVLRLVGQRDDAIGYDAPTTQQSVSAPSTKSQALVVGGIAASAVLLAAGVTFTLLATAKASDASDEQALLRNRGGNDTSCNNATDPFIAANCTSLHGKLVARDTYADLAFGGYFLGAAALGATIAYVLWPEKKERELWSHTVASARPAPMVGNGLGGIMITGSF